MEYEDYLDLEYKPEKTDLVCLFKITPSKEFSVKKAAIRVAAESSNGTWSDVEVPESIYEQRARVFSINEKFVKIAYPIRLFEKGNMSQIISSIAGNVFGMKAVDGLRLEDVKWPKKLIKSFNGPKFGVKGVKDFLGVKDRPVIGSIVKPKVGLDSKRHAERAYEVWMGGGDLVKDDENLTSQSFNRFKKRLDLTLKSKRKAEKETGEKKGYLVNITADVDEMKKRLELVKEKGNEYVMIDILTTGWAAVPVITKLARKNNLRVHAHRAFHSAFDRNPLHGMSMKVVCEIARLQGVDQLHIGALGKLEGDKEYVYNNYSKCSLESNESKKGVLAQEWHGVKPVLSVCSGGLHPGITHRLMDLLGTDIVLQAGGGIHGHPGGTRKGAQAFKESVKAYMKNKTVTEYAENHPVLKKALDKWGTRVYK